MGVGFYMTSVPHTPHLEYCIKCIISVVLDSRLHQKRIKTEIIIREECGHEIRNASHWSVKSIARILYPVLSSRVHERTRPALACDMESSFVNVPIYLLLVSRWLRCFSSACFHSTRGNYGVARDHR